MTNGIRVWFPKDPLSILEAAATVLQLFLLDSRHLSALAANQLTRWLSDPGKDKQPTPATLVNFLIPSVFTYHLDAGYDQESASQSTLLACNSVAVAVECFCHNDRYVNRFKELWRQHIETGAPVSDD